MHFEEGAMFLWFLMIGLAPQNNGLPQVCVQQGVCYVSYVLHIYLEISQICQSPLIIDKCNFVTSGASEISKLHLGFLNYVLGYILGYTFSLHVGLHLRLQYMLDCTLCHISGYTLGHTSGYTKGYT